MKRSFLLVLAAEASGAAHGVSPAGEEAFRALMETARPEEEPSRRGKESRFPERSLLPAIQDSFWREGDSFSADIDSF
jgi:hypothetical protein